MALGIRIGSLLVATLASLSGIAWADPALDKADEFLKNGKTASAEAIYRAYLASHPGYLPAELALARIAVRRFDYPQAQAMLEKSLARNPDSAETAAMLGHLYQRWSNVPGGKVADNHRDYRAMAGEFFKQAKTMNANSPLVLAYLADWQIQQDDLVGAERSIQQALRIRPDFMPAMQAYVRFYIKTRDLARGKNTALQAVELDPNDSENYFLVAQLLGLANRPAEAVKYAEKSEQLDYGKLPERDYFLAAQLEKLGDLPKAAQYYENLTVFTPKEAQVWLKLGEIYDRINQPQKSLAAYQRALALEPELATQLLTEARENTRQERIDLALNQWRRVIRLQAGNPAAVNESLDAIAGLHILYSFLHPGQHQQDWAHDMALFNGVPADDMARQLDIAKMRLAMKGLAPDVQSRLLMGAGQLSPAVSGEAFFLLGNYTEAAARLDMIDGLEAEDYIRLADRLLQDQELTYSRIFYQRAYELSPRPELQTAMKRIAAKQALARQRVDEGNLLFNNKDYPGALAKYEEAQRIYRQWDNVYLRLGDTYELTRQWAKAKAAYDTAIALSPSLMESKGFEKNYRKLEKRALSAKK